MHWRIENSFSSIEWICNDNDMTYIGDANCLIDATVNGKQFSFSRSNIDIATWFLMLALEMTIEEAGLDDASKVMLLSTLIWFLMFLD